MEFVRFVWISQLTANFALHNIKRSVFITEVESVYSAVRTVIIIIIIFINCNWVVTRWQWLFYMYTKYEIGY